MRGRNPNTPQHVLFGLRFMICHWATDNGNRRLSARVMEHLFELENSIACIARCMRTNGTLYVLAPTEGGLGFSAARFVTSLGMPSFSV